MLYDPYKNMSAGTKEVAQSAECLISNNEDLSLDS